MASRIREFPVAREFSKPREIPVTREFPRLKLVPPISWETGISRPRFPIEHPCRALLGTSPRVTALAQPHARLTAPGRLLKQWDSIHQLCSVFAAFITLFHCAWLLSTLALSVHHSESNSLSSANGWKWYTSDQGRDVCLRRLTDCIAHLC